MVEQRCVWDAQRETLFESRKMIRTLLLWNFARLFVFLSHFKKTYRPIAASEALSCVARIYHHCKDPIAYNRQSTTHVTRFCPTELPSRGVFSRLKRDWANKLKQCKHTNSTFVKTRRVVFIEVSSEATSCGSTSQRGTCYHHRAPAKASIITCRVFVSWMRH